MVNERVPTWGSQPRLSSTISVLRYNVNRLFGRRLTEACLSSPRSEAGTNVLFLMSQIGEVHHIVMCTPRLVTPNFATRLELSSYYH